MEEQTPHYVLALPAQIYWEQKLTDLIRPAHLARAEDVEEAAA